MAKQSALDKLIQELKVEVDGMHRDIEAKQKIIARLEMQRPFRKPKPAKPRRVLDASIQQTG